MLDVAAAAATTTGSTYSAALTFQFRHSKSSTIPHQWRIRASSAASTVDLTALQSAIDKVQFLRLISFLCRLITYTNPFSKMQKDSNAVKEALDQLREVGWAKKWSSQPYVSRRTVSPHFQVRSSSYGKLQSITIFPPSSLFILYETTRIIIWIMSHNNNIKYKTFIPERIWANSCCLIILLTHSSANSLLG